MTPDLLRLHRAALANGDNATSGRIICLHRGNVAMLGRWLHQSKVAAVKPVSLVEPMAERKPA